MLESTFGTYRIEELLGRGGMGEVYRAHDTETDRRVALKVLPAHLAEDAEYQERFRRECRAAARLREPHIVPIHRFGEIDGRLYLDMRLVEGMDLASWLKQFGAMPPEVAVSVVSQVAAALDAAHAEGLVHRDVKPSNVLLAGVQSADVTRELFAYLFDFGIARAQEGSSEDPALTRAGTMPGSLAYIAPERFAGIEGDPRADVYSLACVLHQALTGRPPFEGDMATLMNAHLNAPPPRPSTSRPDVPTGLDQVVAQGMAKDPKQRTATAGALAAAARAEVGGLSTPSSPNAATAWHGAVPAHPSNPQQANPQQANPQQANPQQANPQQANPQQAPGTAVIPPGWNSSPQAAPAWNSQQSWNPNQSGYGAQQPAYGQQGAWGGQPPTGGWTGGSHPSHPSYPNQQYTPPPPPPPQRRTGVIVAAVVAALVVIGAGVAIAVALTGGTTTAAPPTSSVTAPPTSAAPPTSSAAPSTSYGPSDADNQLLLQLPVGYGTANCEPQPLAGAVAFVSCAAAPTTGTGPTSATFTRYGTLSAMDAGFDSILSSEGVPTAPGEFTACMGNVNSRTTYSRGGGTEQAGQVACFTEPDGTAYLLWTDNDALGIGYVASNVGDAAALFTWWQANDFQVPR